MLAGCHVNSQCIGHGLVNLQPDGACVVAKLPKLGGEPFEPLDTHASVECRRFGYRGYHSAYTDNAEPKCGRTQII